MAARYHELPEPHLAALEKRKYVLQETKENILSAQKKHLFEPGQLVLKRLYLGGKLDSKFIRY